jgi:hypothetical protein
MLDPKPRLRLELTEPNFTGLHMLIHLSPLNLNPTNIPLQLLPNPLEPGHLTPQSLIILLEPNDSPLQIGNLLLIASLQPDLLLLELPAEGLCLC